MDDKTIERGVVEWNGMEWNGNRRREEQGNDKAMNDTATNDTATLMANPSASSDVICGHGTNKHKVLLSLHGPIQNLN